MAHHPKKKKVLVIDDDADIGELMTIILGKHDYEVKAVTQFNMPDKDAVPDIIVLDVFFANEDGRKICYDLKHHTNTRHVPVLMYSAGTNVEQGALEAGADDFIAKPFEIKLLIEKIKKLEACHGSASEPGKARENI